MWKTGLKMTENWLRKEKKYDSEDETVEVEHNLVHQPFLSSRQERINNEVCDSSRFSLYFPKET